MSDLLRSMYCHIDLEINDDDDDDDDDDDVSDLLRSIAISALSVPPQTSQT